MINYRKLDSCANCKNVFERYEYEEDSEYYCALNASSRPFCNSVAMNEWAGNVERSTTIATHIRLETAWQAWAKGRKVDAVGICDMWEQRTEAAD